MPNIPISDFQEPIAIPQRETQQDEDFPPLNFVPGNPTKKQIINPNDLQQRQEVFSENTNDEGPDEETAPSWLDN